MEEAVKAAPAPRSGSGLDRRFRYGYNSAKDAEHLLEQTSVDMLKARDAKGWDSRGWALRARRHNSSGHNNLLLCY